MHRVALLPIALLLGCGRLESAPLAAQSASTERAAEHAMKSIDFHNSIYLARLDHRIIVSADGVLRSIHTGNKSCGPHDLDPQYELTEIRQGRLTAKQQTDLAGLFADWNSLSSTPYPGVPDGPDVSIRYGDKTISGGSGVPKQVNVVQDRLYELARSMPLVQP